MTLHVPACECGHLLGDHASNRASFPHPVRYGVCLVRGCECREFVEKRDEREAA